MLVKILTSAFKNGQFIGLNTLYFTFANDSVNLQIRIYCLNEKFKKPLFQP